MKSGFYIDWSQNLMIYDRERNETTEWNFFTSQWNVISGQPPVKKWELIEAF